MLSVKPFLDPDITLKKLASRISVQSKHLSQIINKYKNQNFYDYINYYRINEAKNILVDSKNNKTILEVLFECGFNSKSAFNTHFKKITGSTPTQFKNSIRQ
jgi:AraC-like DNA-binding protein